MTAEDLAVQAARGLLEEALRTADEDHALDCLLAARRVVRRLEEGLAETYTGPAPEGAP